jgi:flagellar hook-associated protein 1 FlgK
MTSTFRGLETGKSALAAASLNQDVTGQNIANANTVGYTRQRTDAEARLPVGLNYVVSQVYNKRVGQGVTIKDIQQTRSDYLDEQYRNESSVYANYDYRGQGLTYLTGVMNELDDNSSLTLCLNDFSSALSNLSADPTSRENRLNVQQRANTLIQNLKYVHNEMSDLWSDQNTSVNTVAESINSKAEQISILNVAIANYEHSGGTANDLRDQRNNLLDELSSLTSISYTLNATDASMVDVKIGGALLVEGKKANPIIVTPSATPNTYTGKSENVLTLSNTVTNPDGTITPVVYTLSRNADATKNEIQVGGELQAHMDLLESDDPTMPGIPYYIGQLNQFAQSLAKQVNDIHTAGYTTPDSSLKTTSQTGIAFFTKNGEASKDITDAAYYDGITADNLTLSAEVTDSVWNIAASDTAVDLDSGSTQAGNAAVASKLYKLFSDGTFNTELNTIVGHLAIVSDTNNGLVNTSKSMLHSIAKQRTSVCGVSMDEETTNLIKFQQSYSVASRMVTTLDDMLEKLINSTGRVGL